MHRARVPVPLNRRALAVLAAFVTFVGLGVVAFTATAHAATTTDEVARVDTFVNGAFPDTNYEGMTYFRVDDGNPKIAYLKFDVPAVATGDAITSAKLKLYGFSTDDAEPFKVYKLGNAWGYGITWNTRPSYDPANIVGTGTVKPGGYASVDVDPSWLDPGKSESFAIVRDQKGSDTKFYASENGTNRPTLSVTVDTATVTNAAPVVSAGPDLAVTMPGSATLNGTATDDGNPSGSTLTTSWSMASGPGTVTFGDSTAVDTTASFSTDGTYVLRLTADDGDRTSSDDVQVVVSPEDRLQHALDDVTAAQAALNADPADLATAETNLSDALALVQDLEANPPASGGGGGTTPTNAAPVVKAGADQTVTMPNSAPLDGTVTDDGLPSGTLTTSWSKVSGPGTVTFGDAGLVDTTATFSVDGTYVLRLTADDSALSATDDVTVTVNPQATQPPPPAGDSGSPYIAYEPGSFFTTPLPDNAPLASNSATGISWAKSHDPNDYPTIRGVDGNKWGMPFALSDCSDPLWYFPSNATLPSTVGFLAMQGFHAPANFGDKLAANGDDPFVVIDTCGVPAMPDGLSVWGANVAYDGNAGHVFSTSSGTGGTIVGGAFDHASNGLDKRDPHSDSTINERSRGNIPDSMVIRDDLLSYAETGGNDGTLGHVLEMFWLETDSSAGFFSPMVGAEGGNSGFGAEGERIRVKPNWTPPSTCSAAGKVIAKTLQKYGAYLGDNAGGGSGIKAEQGSTALHIRELSGCITWDDMEFVQPGYSASW